MTVLPFSVILRIIARLNYSVGEKMGLMDIKSGRDVPNEINVIIEIPMHGEPVKYEVNKETGALFVDRFMTTAMFYPTNYGYVPKTLSEDGDPVDVLVVTPVPLISGAVIPCRVVGMLKMTDEAGVDTKVLAVPTSKLSKMYEHVKTYKDLPHPLLLSIEHFFQHYKDLEEGKWVKVDGWQGPEAARDEIIASVARFEQDQ
ncbi:inorganic pyrophosphatase [Legionella feeleii]|uniref:Inorganic pyrophosphatase n=2 Tax=Legionella feeleii TaxID=453 RepID=A0A0W0U5M9_9GAMM|nr:inorganic pyrophosphatase [Legionella feeleii]SPX62325.1 inorganic pyrophosphatase [Legionella feeleii]STX39679.1 inorganic pyrophosphatase [Legionella feeleii]